MDSVAECEDNDTTSLNSGGTAGSSTTEIKATLSPTRSFRNTQAKTMMILPVDDTTSSNDARGSRGFRNTAAAEWLAVHGTAVMDKISGLKKKFQEINELYGNLFISVHEARGLPLPSVLYVRVMIDRIKGPRTSSIYDSEPSWEQDLEIPVAGTVDEIKFALKEEGYFSFFEPHSASRFFCRQFNTLTIGTAVVSRKAAMKGIEREWLEIRDGIALLVSLTFVSAEEGVVTTEVPSPFQVGKLFSFGPFCPQH